MSKKDSELFRQVYEVVRKAPQDFLLNQVTEANDQLRNLELTATQMEELLEGVNKTVLWIAEDDERFFMNNSYSLVETNYGPRIMTHREWQRYQQQRHPRKRRPRSDSF